MECTKLPLTADDGSGLASRRVASWAATRCLLWNEDIPGSCAPVDGTLDTCAGDFVAPWSWWC
jgi:hypothetical protein